MLPTPDMTAVLREEVQGVRAATVRLEERLDRMATREDLGRVEHQVQVVAQKVDSLAAEALQTAPPWAVREIAWLRTALGAVAGAIAAMGAAWVTRYHQ